MSAAKSEGAASRLTLVTTCKPFRGDAGRLQRNALRSWGRLRPIPEILVFGDEDGVREICAEVGARQIPEVARTAAGIPTLSGLADGAARHATREWICLVNADILLTSTVEPAAALCAAAFPRFLLVSRRINLDLEGDVDVEDARWEEVLLAEARRRGHLEAVYGGVDLFLYPRAAFPAGKLPPMAIGRGRWDSALLYLARRDGMPVIDATLAVPNVHQNHDYSHDPGGTAGVFRGADGRTNEELLGGEEFIFSALNATHVLGEDGLAPFRVRHPLLLLRLLATAPALHPVAAPLAPLVRSLAPIWRRARRVRDARLGRLPLATPRPPSA